MLCLRSNEISDINLLENENFKQLKKLYLNENEISDIKGIAKRNFDKLEILNLSDNKILDINILEKVNFEQLKKLDLGQNVISDIKVLAKLKLDKLKILNLDNNKISDIKVLENVKFELLEKLDLSQNEISDINILEFINLKNLKELNLSYNKILDIKILSKLKFENIEILYLRNNNIDYNKYSSIIHNLKFRVQLDYDSTKHENFFDLPQRKSEEGICINIPKLVEKCFNSIYLGSYAKNLFSKPKSYKGNYILNNLIKNEKVTEKPREHRTCDEVFYEYLSFLKNQVNSNYFLFVMKFIILLREFYDISKNKNFAEDKKEQVTNKITPEELPDICNDFYCVFLNSNDFFGINTQNDKYEIIDSIMHFCIWLYINGYTRSKLSLVN